MLNSVRSFDYNSSDNDKKYLDIECEHNINEQKQMVEYYNSSIHNLWCNKFALMSQKFIDKYGKEMLLILLSESLYYAKNNMAQYEYKLKYNVINNMINDINKQTNIDFFDNLQKISTEKLWHTSNEKSINTQQTYIEIQKKLLELLNESGKLFLDDIKIEN
jgi:hypothetical protein